VSVLAFAALALLASIVSGVVIAVVRRNAARWQLYQTPNERSAHTVPTPAGGGIGIVAGSLVALAALWALGGLDAAPWLLAGGASLALLGFLDDLRPLGAGLRLLVQLAVAAGTVAVIGVDAVALLFPEPWMVLGLGGAVLLCVWWINLFNFMDGIDGLAASQAIAMLVGAMLLALQFGVAPAADPLWWWLAAIAAATAAFLAVNWPPARIFMGDAGSLFLGLALFSAALLTIAEGWLTPWQWLLLGALFLVDASVTLITRITRREAPHKAHRSHLYQQLARRWGGARPVLALAIGLNVLVLLPSAFVAGWAPQSGPFLVLVCYGILITIAVFCGAGRPDR
jgi:Fuc2NAc and GlcNAc transferase